MAEDSSKNGNNLTRRDFARAAALAAASAAIPPRIAAAMPHGAHENTPGDDAASARQAEIDTRVNEVYRRYGDWLSADQKGEVRRIAGELQEALEKLRAYPLSNGDQPATVLRVVPDPVEAHRAPRR